MQIGALTVGTGAVVVPFSTARPDTLRDPCNNGLRLLARAGNSGNVYVGTSPSVTTATGNLLNKGAPGSVMPYTIPAEHFNDNGTIYLIADAASQVVDWSYD